MRGHAVSGTIETRPPTDAPPQQSTLHPFRTAAIATRSILASIADAVLPRTCAACNQWIDHPQPCCRACRSALAGLARLTYCPRCGRTMAPESIHTTACAACLRERHWNTAGIVRVGPYAPLLRRMIVSLKFGGRANVVNALADLLVAALRQAEWLPKINCLVPVPMHRLRRWQRPCDHADALARAVSERLRIPVQRAAVRRRAYAPSQTRMDSRTARFENVRDCFAPTRRPRVEGQRVCIIDNLLVTGATIHEVSKVLRATGAKRIYAAVIARTVMAGDFQADPEALAQRD